MTDRLLEQLKEIADLFVDDARENRYVRANRDQRELFFVLEQTTTPHVAALDLRHLLDNLTTDAMQQLCDHFKKQDFILTKQVHRGRWLLIGWNHCEIY